jgi:hypothetical protein
MSAEIELLTALSTQPFSACEAQWLLLLRSLYLPIAYVPAIQAVLEKGRWKSQPDPMAYVRKGSLRCAVRLGILDVRRNSRREVLATDLNFKDSEGKSLGHDDRLGTALHRQDEKFRTGLGAEYGSIYDEDDITNRLPRAVLDKNLEVKWDRVADMAQMDSGERIVLRLRLQGLERDVALATCYTDDDRKILQAAWKRFDRHKDLFKEVLMSGKSLPKQRTQVGQNQPVIPNKPHNNPARPVHEVTGVSQAVQEDRVNQINPASETSSAAPQLEMIFIELPQGGMKISFRKCVAEK